MSLFDNPSDMMCKRSAKKYEDSKGWQNVFYREVTIRIDKSTFKLCFHSCNNTTRYRGQRKHELWTLARCMWINLRRIVIFEGKSTPKLSGNTFPSVLAALSRLMDCVGTFFQCIRNPVPTSDNPSRPDNLLTKGCFLKGAQVCFVIS